MHAVSHTYTHTRRAKHLGRIASIKARILAPNLQGLVVSCEKKQNGMESFEGLRSQMENGRGVAKQDLRAVAVYKMPLSKTRDQSIQISSASALRMSIIDDRCFARTSHTCSGAPTSNCEQVNTKGVFPLKESLESLLSPNSAGLPENAQILLVVQILFLSLSQI